MAQADASPPPGGEAAPSAPEAEAAGPADLSVRNLGKRFGGYTAVDDVSFDVPGGRFFSILGPSGCGKTTLMRMIAGFLEPDGGDIRISGRSMRGVPPNRRPVNMVFQNLALFPMMSVGENVAYGLRCRGEPRAAARVKATRTLERVGLGGFADRRVDQLSGGQRQRVALARCLVLEPAVLLLDEPLGALDLKLREQMKIELKQLQHEFGTTFVYITHDQSEALVMSDQVAVMNRGRFEQIGTPRALYHEPRTAFVASFVGDCNRWSGRLESRSGGSASFAAGGRVLHGTAAADLARGAAVAAFVRPEAIVLAEREDEVVRLANRFAVRVDAVLFDGANSRLLLRPPGPAEPGEPVRAALPQIGPFAEVEPGRSLWMGWPAEACRIFAEPT